LGAYDDTGHTYQIVKTAMTWAAARAWAEGQGGHLAYITRSAEDQALVSMTQLTTGLELKLGGNPSRTVAQVGADVIVDMGNGDQVILVGVTLSSLGSGWIL